MTDSQEPVRKIKKWHFIIPFFYGQNLHVNRKGGAPKNKKIEYLRSTLESLVKHFPDPDIHLFVRDDASKEMASIFPFLVHRLECPPKELPYRMLLEVSKFKYNFKNEDILMFTEDDHILYMADTVKEDIEDAGKDLIFSPHRWSKLFMKFRIKGRPQYILNDVNGVLDNIDVKSQTPQIIPFRHKWEIQDTRNGAYAACWAMRFSTFKKIDLSLKSPPDAWLELGSYAVFDKYPVLKLSLKDNENPGSFIVDHLSGYDYNKRILF